MKRIYRLLKVICALVLISSNALGTTYTAKTGTFSGHVGYGNDYESHVINVPGTSAIKVTIALELIACAPPDGYSDLTCVLASNSSSSYWDIMQISTGSPDYSDYEDDCLVFYTPNDICIDLYFSSNWCYDGYYSISYEAYVEGQTITGCNEWLFDSDADYFYIGKKVAESSANVYNKESAFKFSESGSTKEFLFNDDAKLSHQSDALSVKLGSGTQMTVKENGNVGIGMTPINKFDIGGTTRFSVNTSISTYTKFGNFLSSSYIPSLESMGSVQVVLDQNNNDNDTKYFDIKKNSTTGEVLMRVEEGGNVGIGVADPRTELHVVGTGLFEEDLFVDGEIRTTEVKIEVRNQDWPDYVFDENYNLPSLEEVEEHISENGYLPSIPSAEQVAQEGVSVGEMNKLLLQKIEELTLYMIEQQKQIDEMQILINNLK